MRNFVFILTSFFTTHIFAIQKPCIDSTTYDKWPSLKSPMISNNGNYVSYSISKYPEDSSIVVVQAVHNNKWKTQFLQATSPHFTRDSRLFICGIGQAHDSLCLLDLDNREVKYISGIKSFKLQNNGKEGWLAFKLNNNKSEDLVVRSLTTGQQITYSSVTNYFFSNTDNVILLQKKLAGDSGEALLLIDLLKNKSTTIWKGANIKNIVLGSDGLHLAFIGETKATTPEKSIWFYQPGLSNATRLITDSVASNNYGLSIDRIMGFNRDGSRLFFSLSTTIQKTKEKPDNVDVDIWSYRDSKLQSQQLIELNKSYPPTIHFVINTLDHQVIQIEKNEGERIISPFGAELLNNQKQDFILIRKNEQGDNSEWNWNATTLSSIYLLSTVDGTRKNVCEKKPQPFIFNYTLSNEGKYVVYYDPTTKNYYSLTTSSGITRNITKGIQTIWSSYKINDTPLSPFSTMGLAGWLRGDSAVLIYDQNDIWKIDPTGVSTPVNITNSFGKRHNILFRLAYRYYNTPIDPSKPILLSAFNRKNKEDGFYNTTLEKKVDPTLLTMQPYLLEGNIETEQGMIPLKARDTDIYIISRQSVEEAPNYFVTPDFKRYTALTNIHTENDYNWLRSELISWQLPNRKNSQGILYKPQNFDSTKKYPIVFYYYEQSSNNLHKFSFPALSYAAAIDIPSYVSNGYLVFVPDIHFEIGHPGKSVVNTIVSAVQYLSKSQYIDTKHMGIQGHSRGGWETNYLITHTHIFAAAVSGSGLTDYVSLNGSVRSLAGGDSRTAAFETNTQRMGAMLWDRPDLYIENSPVFKAAEVTTPLLMMSNIKDADIPFEQGVEFFTALRRLGKKVWMLQYDGAGHTLNGNVKAQKDLTIRMQQFFDHYLKETAAPRWMIEGIPAKMKGIDLGYQLEPKGVKPGPGLLYLSPSLEQTLKKPVMAQ